ncbi:chaperone NapD [Shewanella colwelliana]|uniref:Chaperone NapD n=1 Tax=Shewanella colwelliana TaxID=23 RepID=A0A1E5INR2_SHECO|nr:chaperone NapD [Shewanella colwelliana]MCZ4336993.1 chaperone NapD [Shewanella colwelliana]MDX1280336.1 chaperone NapD [Shewanella colwelliana]OEG72116.1 glutamate synthase [Shewanella colwelliana]GIU32594.1 sorbose reductase [Shewanella colwelliana]GIU39535.1 sorbose reductase [Shewanella colwelliana]
MSKELHVTSLVVQVRPEQMSNVRQTILTMENAELSVNDEVKLVVVLEGETQKGLMADIEAINGIEGVLSAAMVYHQSEVLEEGEK